MYSLANWPLEAAVAVVGGGVGDEGVGPRGAPPWGLPLPRARPSGGLATVNKQDVIMVFYVICENRWVDGKWKIMLSVEPTIVNWIYFLTDVLIFH